MSKHALYCKKCGSRMHTVGIRMSKNWNERSNYSALENVRYCKKCDKFFKFLITVKEMLYG